MIEDSSWELKGIAATLHCIHSSVLPKVKESLLRLRRRTRISYMADTRLPKQYIS